MPLEARCQVDCGIYADHRSLSPSSYSISSSLSCQLLLYYINGFGAKISIHKAPVRKGYTFDYWQGSEYHPDDVYIVIEDHTFVAQWKADSPPRYPRHPCHRRKWYVDLRKHFLRSAGGMRGRVRAAAQKKESRHGEIKNNDSSAGIHTFRRLAIKSLNIEKRHSAC